MPAFRLLNLYKTLQSLSTQNPKPIIICCRSCSYPRLPEEFHSISHPRFPYSTIADEPIASKSESISIQIRVRYPLHAAAPRLTVETVYEPATENGLHIKQEIVAGRKKLDPDVEKTENPSSIEMDSGVCEDIKENSSIRGRRKSRSTVHVCQSCGYSDEQWWKTCKQCGEVGTMRRCTTKSADRKVRSSWLPMAAKPIKLTDVYGQVDKLNWLIPLPGIFGAEVETVLGGGLVPGSLVLVGGDPGVGKSTLLVQIAALIAEGDGADVPARVFYVSGEESVEQIGSRADRLCIGTEKLLLYSSTDIQDILEQAQHLSPRALIIDSIQTVHLRGVTGSPGGCVQVKKCTLSLLRFAKKTNIPVILIGHVTKTGGVAGPRVLEHIVDVVLYMEGEKSSSHRLLRSVKNRFGSTDELGVFKMSQSGLQGVSNPSEIFLVEQHSDSDFLPGLAVAVIMDGSRAFLIEIQASCVACSISQRHVDGAKDGRVKMIISVIRKQAGLQLENGIFVNVVGGVSMRERGGDLAIAAAICSSFFELPIPSGIAFIAEVGLGGELRVVHQLEKRINTVAKLGYKKCIVPKSRESSFSDLQTGGMQILECKNLKEMINIVFRTS